MIPQADQSIPAPASAAEILAPPRPNLGPEPLRPEGSFAFLVVASLVIGLVLVAALLIAWRRRRSADQATGPAEASRDDSPEARLLALRDRARAILARRFGPALRARTTEEIAADARLTETLGVDDLARLTNLLRAGDRVLFDRESVSVGNGDPSADLADWTALLETLSRSR